MSSSTSRTPTASAVTHKVSTARPASIIKVMPQQMVIFLFFSFSIFESNHDFLIFFVIVEQNALKLGNAGQNTRIVPIRGDANTYTNVKSVNSSHISQNSHGIKKET